MVSDSVIDRSCFAESFRPADLTKMSPTRINLQEQVPQKMIIESCSNPKVRTSQDMFFNFQLNQGNELFHCAAVIRRCDWQLSPLFCWPMDTGAQMLDR